MRRAIVFHCLADRSGASGSFSQALHHFHARHLSCYIDPERKIGMMRTIILAPAIQKALECEFCLWILGASHAPHLVAEVASSPMRVHRGTKNHLRSQCFHGSE